MRVGEALSCATRLKALRLLSGSEKTVTELSKALEGTEANASAQVKILSRAGLLEHRYEPGLHGIRKYSKTKVKHIIIDLETIVKQV